MTMACYDTWTRRYDLPLPLSVCRAAAGSRYGVCWLAGRCVLPVRARSLSVSQLADVTWCIMWVLHVWCYRLNQEMEMIYTLDDFSSIVQYDSLRSLPKPLLCLRWFILILRRQLYFIWYIKQPITWQQPQSRWTTASEDHTETAAVG